MLRDELCICWENFSSFNRKIHLFKKIAHLQWYFHDKFSNISTPVLQYPYLNLLVGPKYFGFFVAKKTWKTSVPLETRSHLVSYIYFSRITEFCISITGHTNPSLFVFWLQQSQIFSTSLLQKKVFLELVRFKMLHLGI